MAMKCTLVHDWKNVVMRGEGELEHDMKGKIRKTLKGGERERLYFPPPPVRNKPNVVRGKTDRKPKAKHAYRNRHGRIKKGEKQSLPTYRVTSAGPERRGTGNPDTGF